jgi:prevent-host-death family protein
MEVGVRELKARLSEYLGRAAAGESVVVTDRGRPIARIVSFAEGSAVERGIAEGWIEQPRSDRLEPARRHRAGRQVLEVLDEDRG